MAGDVARAVRWARDNAARLGASQKTPCLAFQATLLVLGLSHSVLVAALQAQIRRSCCSQATRRARICAHSLRRSQGFSARSECRPAISVG